MHVIPAWHACLYTPIIESLQPSEKSLCSLWQTDLGQKEQTERGNGEGKHGGWGRRSSNREWSKYWTWPLLSLSLVHKTPIKDVPSPALLWLTQSKNVPPFYRATLIKKKKPGSKCTPKQISKCGAQWPQCRDHPHGVLHHPHLLLLCLHGCISQAQMGFSATRSRAWHALNNGKQMTSQLHLMMASADAAAFLMWRNIRAVWFIRGAQVARDLMSHFFAVLTCKWLKGKCMCVKKLTCFRWELWLFSFSFSQWWHVSALF